MLAKGKKPTEYNVEEDEFAPRHQLEVDPEQEAQRHEVLGDRQRRMDRVAEPQWVHRMELEPIRIPLARPQTFNVRLPIPVYPANLPGPQRQEEVDRFRRNLLHNLRSFEMSHRGVLFQGFSAIRDFSFSPEREDQQKPARAKVKSTDADSDYVTDDETGIANIEKPPKNNLKRKNNRKDDDEEDGPSAKIPSISTGRPTVA